MNRTHVTGGFSSWSHFELALNLWKFGQPNSKSHLLNNEMIAMRIQKMVTKASNKLQAVTEGSLSDL